LNQNDPTDTALAAIASIFGPPRSESEGVDAATDQPHADQANAVQANHESAESDSATEATDAVPDVVPDPGIEGYSRSGPGPLDSLRFKWTARRGDDGEYYVDETIGYASRPISSGPIPPDQVIAFIDERESAARQRFDALRSEMIRGASERSSKDAAEPEYDEEVESES
jgi:hypothetical protein